MYSFNCIISDLCPPPKKQKNLFWLLVSALTWEEFRRHHFSAYNKKNCLKKNSEQLYFLEPIDSGQRANHSLKIWRQANAEHDRSGEIEANGFRNTNCYWVIPGGRMLARSLKTHIVVGVSPAFMSLTYRFSWRSSEKNSHVLAAGGEEN